MPVIHGTTARQGEAIGRWLLVLLFVGGAIIWWWPEYRVWGAMAAAFTAVLGIWLGGQMMLGERTVPGHPMHWSWLGVAGVLAWHVATDARGEGGYAVRGALDVSAAFHLLLVAAAVMLVQCVLSLELVNRPGTIGVLGLALAAGGIAAWASEAPVITPATAMLGLAGCWLALAAAWPGAWWGPRAGGLLKRRGPGRWFWVWRWLVAVLAAGAAAALAVGFAREALASAACLGAALLAAGLLGVRRRGLFLSAGAVVTAAALWALAALRAGEGWQIRWPTQWLGEGEAAFWRLNTATSGLTLLGGMIGWVGVGFLGVGLVWTIARLWRTGGSCGGAEGLGRVGWTAGALTACAAVAMPGGLFVPTSVLAVGLSLGLMPAAFGSRVAGRPAWVLTTVIAAALAVVGVASSGGLARWAAMSLGGGDIWPHTLTGFLLAMTLAWWWGARRTWLGLAGIATAVLIGGAGEVAQQLFTSEGGQWHDWGFHTLGCLPAALVLLLGRYARGCELPDGRAQDLVSGSHRWQGRPKRLGR